MGTKQKGKKTRTKKRKYTKRKSQKGGKKKKLTNSRNILYKCYNQRKQNIVRFKKEG